MRGLEAHTNHLYRQASLYAIKQQKVSLPVAEVRTG